MLARKALAAILLSVAVDIAIPSALILLPVPQPFSLHGAEIHDLWTTCPGISPTPGTTVHFTSSTSNFTWFAAVNCSAGGGIAYEGDGTSGSGSFVASGGAYRFGSLCPGDGTCSPADVHGTFTGPLVPL